MPYGNGPGRFERAHPAGHVPTVQNDLVQERLANYELPQKVKGTPEHARVIEPLLHDARTLDGYDRKVNLLLAVDGSVHEEPIETAFPSTTLLFLQVAGVIVDLEKLRRKVHGFADPAAQMDAQDNGVLAGFLPGSNLTSISHEDPTLAFRREVHTLLSRSEINKKRMLDVLMRLRHLAVEYDDGSASGENKKMTCPNGNCPHEFDLTDIEKEEQPCPRCGEPIWLSDTLRIHEAFNPYEANMTVGTRMMLVLEHLTLALFGSWILENAPSSFGDIAFISDGPLAMFGEPSRWRRPILIGWQKLAEYAAGKGLGCPMILGIEKSGTFVEHAVALDKLIPPGHLMELPSDYVSEYVLFKNTKYGVSNYYGRKFIYKTADERTIVFSVPPLGRVGALPYGANASASLAEYPTLGATCSLLDKIGTRLFDNAVIPLALAHKWASYPLKTAGSVLSMHAKEHLAVVPKSS